MLEVGIGSNHVRVQIGDIRFTSKLIDGRFPEYGRVIPNQPPLLVTAVRDDFASRCSAPPSPPTRNIEGFVLRKPNALTIQSHNPEQEEAEEEVEVGYEGPELEIGFNVNYLMDALAAIEGRTSRLALPTATAVA